MDSAVSLSFLASTSRTLFISSFSLSVCYIKKKQKKNSEKTFRLVAHYLGFKSTAEINPIILTLKNSVLNRPISSA